MALSVSWKKVRYIIKGIFVFFATFLVAPLFTFRVTPLVGAR